MGLKVLIGGTVVGLVALATSLFAPIIPEKDYTFIGSSDGKSCEIKQVRRSVYSPSRRVQHDERVVRVKGGTGYEISPGYILTNDHIAKAYRLGILNPPILIYSVDDSNSREGAIIERSETDDLALISVQPRELTGKVKFREQLPLNARVTLRTINPTNGMYSRKSSLIDIDAISKSYILPSSLPSTAHENAIHGNTSAGIRYTSDLFTGAGMSGSSITDQNGSIVGVYSTGGANLTRGFGYAPARAFDPFEKTEELKRKYPDAEFYFSSTEPSSIVKFLQRYCNKPKDSIVRFSANSRDREFYKEHGYDR